MDIQRAQSMNPKAKKKWFELLEKLVMKVVSDLRTCMVWMKLAVHHLTRAHSAFVGVKVRKHSINRVEPTVKM